MGLLERRRERVGSSGGRGGASTTEYEALGGQAAVPNQISSIVDPFIIEEARRRCEQDQNKEELVQLIFPS